jgi:hypothetical protein
MGQTVKEQTNFITSLVIKYFKELGFVCQGSDYGKDLQFENPKTGEFIEYTKGYFGANSEPSVTGQWYNGDEVSKESLEAEEQVLVYINELKKSYAYRETYANPEY